MVRLLWFTEFRPFSGRWLAFSGRWLAFSGRSLRPLASAEKVARVSEPRTWPGVSRAEGHLKR